jgi:hypothetical protein
MDIYGKEAASIDVGLRLRLLREERDISMRRWRGPAGCRPTL